MWQYIDTLSVSRVQLSSQQAKNNAAMTLVSINTLRITMLMLLEKVDGQLLPLEFVNELSTISTDEDMKTFVNSKFRPLLADSNNLMSKFPDYKDGVQPFVQLFAFLYGRQKDRQVEAIRTLHSLFWAKLNEETFSTGIHNMVMCVLAALMTQSDQALRMYPVLTTLGK